MITITVENNVLVVDGADVLIDRSYVESCPGKVAGAKHPSGISGLPVIQIDGSIIDRFDGILSNNGIEVKNLEAAKGHNKPVIEYGESFNGQKQE